MAQKPKKIVNPLTIIGIFAGLIEGAMVTALGLIEKSLQPTFIWFIMGFTVILVLLFFATLNFNSKVLYAPSDFKDETLFIENMRSGIKIENINSDFETKEKIEYFKNKTFNNQTIDLDNKDYSQCVFNNCTLIYRAEGHIGIQYCEFNNVSWKFENNAAKTMLFLSSLYELGEGGRIIVEKTFENIKSGKYTIY
jgi:hypothetical protein